MAEFPQTKQELEEFVDDRVKTFLTEEGADEENEQDVPTVPDDELQPETLLMPLIRTSEQGVPERYIKARVSALLRGVAESSVSSARLSWIDEQMQSDLAAEAQTKFVVSTSPSENSSYLTDELNEKSMTVQVETTFDGDPVDCGTVSGWSHTEGTNVYTKTIRAYNGNSYTLSPVEFTYTPPTGKYAGIEVKGSSASKTISAVKPFYYGWGTGNDAGNVASVVGGLTRVTKNTDSGTFVSTPEGEKYLWFVVASNRTLSATQQNKSIMEAPVTKNFTSPINDQITLSDYKVYISELSAASEVEVDWEVS